MQIVEKINGIDATSYREAHRREKGAYTEALTRQGGRFELAHGSTSFLDEIAVLPSDP